MNTADTNFTWREGIERQDLFEKRAEVLPEQQ
jgi:hypothetical protein